MQRTTVLTPISLLVSGCVLIVLLLQGPQINSNAAPSGQNESYPPASETTTTAYPGPSANTTGTATTAPAAQTAVPPASAPVAPTISRPATTVTTLPAPVAPQPTTQRQAPTVQAQPTALPPTPTVDTSVRNCVPGEEVRIAGNGPANAGFLVSFDRRVVSGGSIRNDGSYAISLIVGNEAAGSYLVEVRVRGSRQILESFTCQVPNVAPTALR